MSEKIDSLASHAFASAIDQLAEEGAIQHPQMSFLLSFKLFSEAQQHSFFKDNNPNDTVYGPETVLKVANENQAVRDTWSRRNSPARTKAENIYQGLKNGSVSKKVASHVFFWMLVRFPGDMHTIKIEKRVFKGRTFEEFFGTKIPQDQKGAERLYREFLLDRVDDGNSGSTPPVPSSGLLKRSTLGSDKLASNNAIDEMEEVPAAVEAKENNRHPKLVSGAYFIQKKESRKFKFDNDIKAKILSDHNDMMLRIEINRFSRVVKATTEFEFKKSSSVEESEKYERVLIALEEFYKDTFFGVSSYTENPESYARSQLSKNNDRIEFLAKHMKTSAGYEKLGRYLAACLRDYAYVLDEAKFPAESITAIRTAVKIYSDVLGPFSFDYLNTKSQLAMELASSSSHAETRELFYSIRKALNGMDSDQLSQVDFDAASFWLVQAKMFDEIGQYELAEELFLERIEIAARQQNTASVPSDFTGIAEAAVDYLVYIIGDAILEEDEEIALEVSNKLTMIEERFGSEIANKSTMLLLHHEVL
jgi:tetratricopeptide (TPR) repeat protein